MLQLPSDRPFDSGADGGISSAVGSVAASDALSGPIGVGGAAGKAIELGPIFEGPGAGGDTVASNTSTSSSIAAATSMRGYINSEGDQDWYRVTLIAGQTYTFAENGFGVGALTDPFIRLYNSSGVLIASNDDSGPLWGSLLRYTVPTGGTGTYYISAGAFSGTGQYLLTMNQGTAQYNPTVSLSDVADYLTNSFWEVNGESAAKWSLSSISYNVTGLEPERAALARIAFKTWSDVANVSFVETTGAARITLDDTDPNGAYEFDSRSGSTIISASINVASNWYGGIDAVDSYTLQTFIHEIGHALGLGHGGPYNGSATYGVHNVYANDSWHLSVMSYMDQIDAGTGSFRFLMTPAMADILAVQRLYGAPTTRSGDTIYGFGSNAGFDSLGVNLYDFSFYQQAPALTIYDSGGIDTLNASGYSQNQVIDLQGGNFSNIGGLIGNIGIYTATVIENAIGGSGNDVITGNAADNLLVGGAGNDMLTGLAGNDHIEGGAGSDTAVFSGNQLDYLVRYFAQTQVYSVEDRRAGAPEGADTTSQIEYFRFADGTVAVTTSIATILNNLDGSITVRDLAGQQSWTSYTDFFNGSGVRIAQTGINDDGTTWHLYNDWQDAQDWTWYSNTFSGGNRISQVGLNDDGTNWQVTFDGADAFDWTWYNTVFDSVGRIEQTGLFDDGTNWVSRFDPHNSYDWVWEYTLYGVNGRIAQTGLYDDGRNWDTRYDAEDAYDWAFYTTIYDAAGQFLSQQGVNDDGTTWLI